MIAFNIWNSSLIPLLGVWIYVAQIHVNLSSWFAEFFAGIKPTTLELIVPRYDQLNKFYIVSDWIRCVNLSIRVTKSSTITLLLHTTQSSGMCLKLPGRVAAYLSSI